MANKYIDSAATGGSNNGTSWANAYLTFADAAAADSAGDVFYVKNTHSESSATSLSYEWAGTFASPTRILCVSDSNEPPTTLATGAVVQTTGTANITIFSTGYAYIYGVRFKAGDSTNAADIVLSNDTNTKFFEQCGFEIAGNNANSDVVVNSNSCATFLNCTFKVANSGSNIWINTDVKLNFRNCSWESGGTSPNPVIFISGYGSTIVLDGFDLSNCSSSSNICTSTGIGTSLIITNSKFPASWSGSINSSTPGLMSQFTLQNCDSTDTNYRLEHKTIVGTITSETTLVRTGGASDGSTSISWKMVSNASVKWNHETLNTINIVRWNETTGSSITVTVEILHDSATNLTDKEIWLDVQYLGTSGFPLASSVNDAAATYLTSAADQTTSSETWTTTGMSNPNKQKLSVSFTPQEKGYIHAVVKLAKASYTVYIDPMVSIT